MIHGLGLIFYENIYRMIKKMIKIHRAKIHNQSIFKTIKTL